MKTPTRVLAALLLALAGCSVSTDDLRPRTQEECGGALKACGYKCVALDDPATGCGDPASCQPCAGGAAGYCDAGFACRIGSDACDARSGLFECDAAVAGCEDVRTDAGHCGVCGHACPSGSACEAGLCRPETLFGTSGVTPGDVECVSGRVYWVDVDGLLHDDTASVIAGAVSFGARPRLATDPLAKALYLAGSSGVYGRIWQIADPSLSTAAAEIDTHATPLGEDTGLGVSGAFVYWTAPDEVNLHWVNRVTPASTGSLDLGAGPRDVAGTASGAVVLRGQALTAVGDLTPPPAVVREIGTLPGPADRVAVGRDGAGDEVVYVGSLADGSVRAHFTGGVIEEVWPALGPVAHMDLVADAQGAYWTNATSGRVWEYRVSDGIRIPLASGGTPWGLCARPGSVVWSDASSKEIHSVTK